MAWIIYVVTAIIWTSPIVASIGLINFGDGYRMLRKIISEAPIDVSSVETRWIKQPLDHFNKSEVRTWSMRYFEWTDMWKPGGPIYLFIGGEEEAFPGYLKIGTTYDLASETNGALYMSEHRFYGESIPLSKYGPENFKYLSSRQALADLSWLIKLIKGTPKYKSSKVVLVGGSYPGSLATWMKLLYPDQIDAAWASSAPVLAKQDFYEYLETVTDVFEEYGGKECSDRIKSTFQMYSDLMKTEKGIETLKARENICKQSNMSRPENQHLFTHSQASVFAISAQHGGVSGIKDRCDNFPINESLTSIVGGAWSAMEQGDYSFWNPEDYCVDIDYDKVLQPLQAGRWPAPWLWQRCTEFSYAKSTSSNHQVFSKNIPLQAFYKLCIDVFGEDYGENNVARSVVHTNAMYGGLTPNVEKIVFVNGEIDPFHTLGILKDLSKDAPAKLVPRSTHCADLMPSKDDDPVELVEARKFAKHKIKQWIGIISTN